MSLEGGWPMTGNFGGRPWPRRAWTGPCLTPGSTARLSWEGHGPSPAVRCASRTTTRPATAHGTRTAHGGRGLPAQGQQGRHHRSKARCLRHHGSPQRCAGASTRVTAVWRPAGIFTPARSVGGSPCHACNRARQCHRSPHRPMAPQSLGWACRWTIHDGTRTSFTWCVVLPCDQCVSIAMYIYSYKTKKKKKSTWCIAREVGRGGGGGSVQLIRLHPRGVTVAMTTIKCLSWQRACFIPGWDDMYPYTADLICLDCCRPPIDFTIPELRQYQPSSTRTPG